MKRSRYVAALMTALLIATVAVAQAKGKKSYTFKGKVESIDTKNKNLTVNGENVDGWMAAMTMAYDVDNPDEVLKKVKVGDKITATVYEGDYKLYKVQVVPPAGKDEKKDEKKKP